MNCKAVILALIMMVVSGACASTSILGKWKLSRGYNPSKGTWEMPNPPSFALEMEFLNDGKLVYRQSNQTFPADSYTSDISTEPHRLVTTSPPPNERRKYAVYKIDGNKLILKSYRDEKLGFPTDVGIEVEGSLYDLLEFERQP